MVHFTSYSQSKCVAKALKENRSSTAELTFICLQMSDTFFHVLKAIAIIEAMVVTLSRLLDLGELCLPDSYRQPE